MDRSYLYVGGACICTIGSIIWFLEDNRSSANLAC